jgi:hypothetical protein
LESLGKRIKGLEMQGQLNQFAAPNNIGRKAGFEAALVRGKLGWLQFEAGSTLHKKSRPERAQLAVFGSFADPSLQTRSKRQSPTRATHMTSPLLREFA